MSEVIERKILEEIYPPSSFKDKRCFLCKQHKYVVVDYYPQWNHIQAIHSHLEEEGISGSVKNSIHWWIKSRSASFPESWKSHYHNFSGYDIPKCLDYYKETM